MTLFEIYSYLNAIINKTSLGGDFNLKEFNYLLKDENLNFFKDNVEELYANQRAGALVPDVVYASKILRPFVTESTISPSTGVINLSSALTNYAYFITARTTDEYNGQIRVIPLITHEQMNNMLTNMISPPIKKNPACTIDGDSLRIKPNNISSVIIDYLRYPATPVFDYYIDVNDNVVYLAPSTNHTIVSGETGSAGQVAGTLTSTSVELEFKNEFHPEFIIRLARRMGIPERDQVLLQQTMIEKQEKEAK